MNVKFLLSSLPLMAIAKLNSNQPIDSRITNLQNELLPLTSSAARQSASLLGRVASSFSNISHTEEVPPTFAHVQEDSQEAYRHKPYIDLDNLSEYYGIKPGDIKTVPWRKGVEGETFVDAEDLIRLSTYELDCVLNDEPSISCSFRFAMEFITSMIYRSSRNDQTMQDADHIFVPIQLMTSAEKEIYSVIATIEIPENAHIEDSFGTLPIQNNDALLNKHWLGAVLRTLQDQGHISCYGLDKFGTLWVGEKLSEHELAQSFPEYQTTLNIAFFNPPSSDDRKALIEEVSTLLSTPSEAAPHKEILDLLMKNQNISSSSFEYVHKGEYKKMQRAAQIPMESENLAK